MIRIRLSDQDARRLEDEYRRAKDLAYRDRLQIVRLASRDRTHQVIAADLGIAPRTVRRWLNRYLELGLTGLRSRRPRLRSRPSWPRRSAAGSSRGRSSRAWTGPAGPMPS